MDKILIIEDDVEINTLLTDFLKENGYVVYSQYDGLHVLDFLHKEKIDLIILDIMLPYRSGDIILADIRRQFTIPVLIISAKETTQNKIDLLRLGADDYITKPFSPKIVVAKVETILRRTESDFLVSAPISYGNGFLQIDYQNMLVRRQGEIIHLTPTEYQILFTMAKAPHRIFTRDQLISFALNDDFGGYDRSIDTFIKSIRSKIEPDRKKPIFIITVHGLGYQFLGRKDTGENECEHCELK